MDRSSGIAGKRPVTGAVTFARWCRFIIFIIACIIIVLFIIRRTESYRSTIAEQSLCSDLRFAYAIAVVIILAIVGEAWSRFLGTEEG